jgi:hypothetical protein
MVESLMSDGWLFVVSFVVTSGVLILIRRSRR